MTNVIIVPAVITKSINFPGLVSFLSKSGNDVRRELSNAGFQPGDAVSITNAPPSLIAAAPEMLAALEELFAAHQWILKNHPTLEVGPTGFNGSTDTVGRARAALQKAKGGS